ncbi:MAG: T9SS type A sorting domain-containing protein [Chlorobi bacterium]|nr:T9SS type A sorting domain-containing protein [Chlorobiota bacterium]
MRIFISFIFFSLIFITTNLYAQEIPFPNYPDWESSASGRSTGLGLADINGDGWKDIIIANGNDMARQHLVVYYNQGDGTFPLDPDWQSDDIDYHGHLAVGDVNHDGWPDVAVSVYIGAGGFSDPGKVKIYYNQGGELEGTPSFESYEFYTFSCAFGDADGDGDLDLATTGGEPYSDLYDVGKIFINNDGSFSENPEWTSNFSFGSLDVDFGDMDQNGFLDVIFSCEETPNYIFLANEQGVISDTAGWYSLDPYNYINSLDIGFTGPDKIPSIVMTGNNQLGGNGEVWKYSFPDGVPASGSADWSSNPFGYGSGVLLADVSGDSILDLIYGGWWLPVKIALGDNEGGFEVNPSYTSATSSVVEAIQMADLDRDDIHEKTETFYWESGKGPVIYLEKQLIENILSVKVNNEEIDDTAYCYVPNKNWISFADNFEAGDTIEVKYEYSNDCDIVISNWDSNKGNYIFYNTLITGIIQPDETGGNKVFLQVAPNPVKESLNVFYSLDHENEITIQLVNIYGQPVNSWFLGLKPAGNHYFTKNIGLINPGIYFLVFRSGNVVSSQKIIIQ